MDGDGSDFSYSRAHRALPLTSRNLLEDPLYQRSHGSQFVQMADLVAFTGYPSLLTTGDKTLTRRWYADHLASKDVTGGRPMALRETPATAPGLPGHRLLVSVNHGVRLRPVPAGHRSGVTGPRFGGAFVYPRRRRPADPGRARTTRRVTATGVRFRGHAPEWAGPAGRSGT
jgi:hypothetical protein